MPATTLQTAQIRDLSITEAKLSLSDNTTGNVNTSRHGFVPKASNNSLEYLNGSGLWSNPINLNSAPGNNTFSGPAISLTAGQNLAQWDVCYINNTSKMMKGSGIAIASSVIIAMATDAITSNASGLFVVGTSVIQNNSWSWTPGGLLYLSVTTAGAMTQTVPTGSGQCVVVLGVALSATTIYFNPNLVIVEIA